jgi:hypothetical protein
MSLGRTGDTTMRFMVMVKSDGKSEAGVLPDEKLLSEMGKYNEELIKAGVMLAGEGLHPSSKGARVRAASGKLTVIDGPFAEAKELVAGYWILQAKSKADAVKWLERAPFEDGEVEIREVYEMSDFITDPAQKADWVAKEAELRAAPTPPRIPGTTRFLVCIKGDKFTEAGTLPSERLLNEMGALMDEVAKAGALLAGEGLKPTSKGARIRYSGTKRTVIDGPFTEAKELVAGYSLVQMKTKEEAVEFAKRQLRIHCDGADIPTGEIEVRQVSEIEDFPVDPAEQPGGWRDQERAFRDRQ